MQKFPSKWFKSIYCAFVHTKYTDFLYGVIIKESLNWKEKQIVADCWQCNITISNIGLDFGNILKGFMLFFDIVIYAE